MGGRGALFLAAVVAAGTAAAYPFFAWGGPHGGAGSDIPLAVATGPGGDTVVMAAVSGDGPLGAGPAPTGTRDVLLMRYDPYGFLAWSHYFAGAGDDGGVAGSGALHVGLDGTITFAFTTPSPDLPVLDAYQDTHAGATDAYVGRLSPDGLLEVATYLGGAGDDVVAGLAVHAGRVTLGLTTTSPALPSAVPYGGGKDAYLASFDTSLGNIVMSRYLGGGDDDRLGGLSADPMSTGVFLGGSTRSTDFPQVATSLVTFPRGWDAFATLVAGNGDLTASTTYGGEGDDLVHATARSSSGLLVAGQTTSADLPLQLPVQDHHGGQNDAFLATFTYTWTLDLVHASYLGGSWSDAALGAAWLPDGRAALVGLTFSSDFPTAFAPLPYGGDADGFFAVIDPYQPRLDVATHIGGCRADMLVGIGTPSPAAAGLVPVLGQTLSPDVPMAGSIQEAPAGLHDLYAMVLAPQGSEGPEPADCPEGDPVEWSDSTPPEGGEGTGDPNAEGNGEPDGEPDEGPPGPCGLGPCPPPCGPPIEAPFAERRDGRVRVTWNGPLCGEMAVYNGTRLLAHVASTDGLAWDEAPWDAAHAYRLVWNGSASAYTNVVPAIGAYLHAPGTHSPTTAGTTLDLRRADPQPDGAVAARDSEGWPWLMAALTLGLPIAAIVARRL